jgi:hypothetical protein
MSRVIVLVELNQCREFGFLLGFVVLNYGILFYHRRVSAVYTV